MEQPITRVDLEALFSRFADHFDKRLDGLSQDTTSLKADIAEIKADIAGLKTETERIAIDLLTAFHNWVRTHEVRTRGVSSAVVGFDERLMIIEDRLSEVERKLLRPS
jgi:hypothetical protein